MKNINSRILIKDDNVYPIKEDFLPVLENVLFHFSWKVIFGEYIEEISEDCEENNSKHKDYNRFLKNWITTFEDAMEDHSIDYTH